MLMGASPGAAIVSKLALTSPTAALTFVASPPRGLSTAAAVTSCKETAAMTLERVSSSAVAAVCGNGVPERETAAARACALDTRGLADVAALPGSAASVDSADAADTAPLRLMTPTLSLCTASICRDASMPMAMEAPAASRAAEVVVGAASERSAMAALAKSSEIRGVLT